MPGPHKVGDRVSRPVDVFDYDNPAVRHGVVTRRYSDYTSRYGPYPELYAVRWDGETQETKGYLRHGLHPE